MALTDNLVNYYKLDDNAASTAVDDFEETTDLVANENTDQYSDASGVILRNFDLDGTDDYAQAAITIDTTNFSMQAWVQNDSGIKKVFVEVADSTTSYFGSQLSFNDNTDDKFRFYIYDGTTLVGGESTNTFADDDTWYHLVGTYDGTNSRLYVNGVLEGTFSGTISNMTFDSAVIGGHWNGSVLSLDHLGKIDEVGFWEKQLVQAEIDLLYNSGAGLARSEFGNATEVVSSALSLSTSLKDPIILMDVTPSAALSLSLTVGGSGAAIVETLNPTFTKGQKEVMTRWPVTSGLTARTERQEGRQMNLVPTRSFVTRQEKIGHK